MKLAMRQRAYDSLIKIGGSAVPSLVPLLASEEDDASVGDGNHQEDRQTGRRTAGHGAGGGDDRLKTKIMKVLDRMGYKPEAVEAQPEPAKLLS